MSKAAVSVSALPGLSAADRTSRRQRIFLPAALAATALAIIGFWRNLLRDPLLAGGATRIVVMTLAMAS